MAEKRRRPPGLSDSALGLGGACQDSTGNIGGLDARSRARTKARDRIAGDIQRCFERLHEDVESIVQRHCSELRRHADQWVVGEDGFYSACSEPPRVGISSGLSMYATSPPESASCKPETPKLPPPPSGLTHVLDASPPHSSHGVRGCSKGSVPNMLGASPAASELGHQGMLRLIAEGFDDGDFHSPMRRRGDCSPMSCSSTRTGTHSNSQRLPHELTWDSADDEGLRSFQYQQIPRPPTAAWSESGIPLPPETRPSSAVSRGSGGIGGAEGSGSTSAEMRGSTNRVIGRSAELGLLLEDLEGSGDTGGSGSSSTQGQLAHVPGRATVALEMSGFVAKRPKWLSLDDSDALNGTGSRATMAATPSTRRSNTLGFSPLSKRKSELVSQTQSRLERFTKGHHYEVFSALLIVLNAVFVAWETKRRADLSMMLTTDSEKYWQKSAKDEVWFGIAANLFCLGFVVDLALRICAERRAFLRSREWGWNVFDAFVSTTAVLEALAQWAALSHREHAGPSGYRMFLRKFSMLRILRLLRVVRMTRVIRIIRFIRELRLMVFSLTGSLKSLAWAVVLLLIVLLVFGVFFTDGAVAYCVQHDAMQSEDTRELRQYFGQLSISIISLYMAMSGGEDWSYLMHALKPLPVEYTLLFLGFVTFAILALLNVITAVFVGTAMQRSQNDRELIVQQELEHKGELIAIMTQVFDELDSSNCGELCLEEFEKHMDDEKIMAYLRYLEIDVSQVRTLFRLLDVDQTGYVDLDEFVNGVMRLKGGATSMDLAVLKYQVECVLHKVLALSKHVGADDRPGSSHSQRVLTQGFRNTLQ